jgi:hypothetical protein
MFHMKTEAESSFGPETDLLGAQLSKLHLKMETESSLGNVVF